MPFTCAAHVPVCPDWLVGGADREICRPRSIKWPVAVFIDDLDRCNSEYVVQLLEGIQTVFGNAAVTYVVAADRHWVRTAYQSEYEKFAGEIGEPARPLGALLLEKTFQLSVPVPCIPSQTLADYWQKLIGEQPEALQEKITQKRSEVRVAMKDLKPEQEILEHVRKTEGDAIVRQAAREEAAVRLAAPEMLARTEHALRPFAPLLDGNPRSMKRLVNSYGIQRSLATLAGEEIPQDQLALWTILDMRWPDLAEYLEGNHEHVELVGKQEKELEEKKVPAKYQSLFRDKDVAKVVNGETEGVSAKLTKETIEKCDKMRS